MSFITRPLEALASWYHPSSKRKNIYFLHEGGNADHKILSTKGANLCEMSRRGFDVPSAFILSTENSLNFELMPGGDLKEQRLPDGLFEEICGGVLELERATGRQFGAPDASTGCPLLLSIRCGGPSSPSPISYDIQDNLHYEAQSLLGVPESWSLPGIQESILGLGLNDEVAEKLSTFSSRRFAYNAYAHFYMRFATVVMGIDPQTFDATIRSYVDKTGRRGPSLTPDDLHNIVVAFKGICTIPTDPYLQLRMAITSSYVAWFSPEAIKHRRDVLDIPDSGVAVIVQSMVYGSVGYGFTRDPTTGDKGVTGDIWLTNGVKQTLAETRQLMPDSYKLLEHISNQLEIIFKDMQTMEFVVDETLGKIFLLQSRPGKRTPKAGVKIAVNMVEERIITEREALLRIDLSSSSRGCLDYFYHAPDGSHGVAIGPYTTATLLILPESPATLAIAAAQSVTVADLKDASAFGSGVGASPGLAYGYLTFSATECLKVVAERKPAVFFIHSAASHPLSSEMCQALKAATAVIDMRGIITNDSSTLCRALGIPCIVGVRDVDVIKIFSASTEGSPNIQISSTTLNDPKILRHGDLVTVDGTLGKVFPAKAHPTGYTAALGANFEQSAIVEHVRDLKTLAHWAGKYKHMNVMISIASPADKILLCSTQLCTPNATATRSTHQPGPDFEVGHKTNQVIYDGVVISTDWMFTASEDRLSLLRTALFNKAERQKMLGQLGTLQREDFRQMFRHCHHGKPVHIRLLDEPLASILPAADTSGSDMDMAHTAKSLNVGVADIRAAMQEIQESNPSLGLRGCRIVDAFPHIAEMQLRAIFEAQLDVLSEGLKIHPHIVVSQISSSRELDSCKEIISKIAMDVYRETDVMNDLEYPSVGIGGPVDPQASYSIAAESGAPRFCLRSDTIAPEASTLCFNASDLTQQVYATARCENAKVLPSYLQKGLYMADPFKSIDDKAVGELLKIGIDRCHRVRPFMHLGIRGDFVTDARSMRFFQDMGINYLIASPEQILVTKLGAAQANIRSAMIQAPSALHDAAFYL